MQLTDFKVLSFDCYGTLIDWETRITEALQPLLARSEKGYWLLQAESAEPPIHARELGLAGYRKQEILHTAESLFHDHGPASQLGLATAWIYRRHAQKGFGATSPPDPMPKYDFRFVSLEEMAGAHRAALKGRNTANS